MPAPPDQQRASPRDQIGGRTGFICAFPLAFDCDGKCAVAVVLRDMGFVAKVIRHQRAGVVDPLIHGPPAPQYSKAR